jgi:hypothetical protein
MGRAVKTWRYSSKILDLDKGWRRVVSFMLQLL